MLFSTHGLPKGLKVDEVVQLGAGAVVETVAAVSEAVGQ